jgi:hypothetical protein
LTPSFHYQVMHQNNGCIHYLLLLLPLPAAAARAREIS